MEPDRSAATALARLTRWWPVRLLIYLGALLLVVLATKALSLPLVPAAPSPLHEPLVTLRNLLQAIAMIAVYAALVRRIEHRAAGEVGLRGAAAPLLSGLALGAGLIGIAYLILFALGIVRFDAGTGFDGVAVALLKPAVVGTLEELVFRVVLFRILQQIAGTAAAALLSAGLFGLAHAANPGATPLALAFLTVELGVLLALVYTLTESLWAVAGVHIGWNFVQDFVFGAEVSGLRSSTGLLRTSLAGPDWLTGGAFGVEGSAVTLAISLIAIAATLALIARRKKWRPASFTLRAA